MKELGLNGSDCKHIPEIYLKNSVEVRSQVFAGLIDTRMGVQTDLNLAMK